MNDLHCTLRSLLQERGISLNALAKQTGIAYTTLHRLVHNKFERIDAHALERVCHCLRVAPGDILQLKSSGQSSTLEPEFFLKILIGTFIDLHTADLYDYQEGRERRLTALRQSLNQQIDAYLQKETDRMIEFQRQQTVKSIERLLSITEKVLPPDMFDGFEEQITATISFPGDSLDDFKERLAHEAALMDALSDDPERQQSGRAMIEEAIARRKQTAQQMQAAYRQDLEDAASEKAQ